MEQRIPRTWRQAKVIALQKPGKDPHVAANYRPISLLSVCYKLLERIVLQRINPVVEDLLSMDQAVSVPTVYKANGSRSPLVSARAASLHRTHLLLAWIKSWIGR